MKSLKERHSGLWWGNVARLLAVSLSIPLTAATFAPDMGVPQSEFNTHRCPIVHRVTTVLGDASDWYIIARDEDPEKHSWQLVAWYDSPTRAGDVDPTELLVLEKPVNSDVLIATTRSPSAGPCEPLDMERIGESEFLYELRRDLGYRSVVLGVAEYEQGVGVIATLIESRVRELEEPRVSLTSVSD